MRILFATDGSECAHHAMRQALRLLGPMLKDAQVFLLSVAPKPLTGVEEVAGLGMTPQEAAERILKEEFAEVHAHLGEAQRLLGASGLHATLLEHCGDPADEIVGTARELGVDLIVLGSHGRGAAARLVLGSTSEKVLHHWSGAILVIRP